MKTTTREMMNENKARIVAAFRAGDWTLTKLLTQERQKLKRRLKAQCVDCGVLIARGLARCRQHATRHRYYARSLASAAALLLAVSALPVDLAWNANPPAEQATYYVYQSTNVAGPFNVVTNVSTNFVTLPLPPAQYFWFVTASNYWSESGPSNVTNVPPQASNVKSLTVRK